MKTFLFYVVDIFSKYAWVIPLKDKKGITYAFQKILDNLIPNWTKYGWIKAVNFTIEQWNHFRRILQDFLQGISVIAERFTRRTLKNKNYKYISSISKNVIYILTLKKVLNLKLVILFEYQNINIFLQMVMFQIDRKKFLWLKKFKVEK